MRLSVAIQGFLTHMKAEGYSPSTVDLYTYVLDNLKKFLKDPEVESIKSNDLNNFFVYLRESYKPVRKNKNTSPLSGSSLQNHWKGLRTFFRWVEDELNVKRPDLKLKLPKNNPKVIMPLTKDELKALLKAAEFTDVIPSNRRPYKARRKTSYRDIALILVMLDSGLRVGEISRLYVRDVNLETGEVYIAPFGNSDIKTKSRLCYIGKATKKALWKYLASRNNPGPDSPLFASETNTAVITPNSIRSLLKDLGSKAGIRGVHPHRFRHTFGVEYLKAGGDIYTLKAILGHSSFKMVEVYLQLSKLDIKEAHRKASPTDNLIG